MSRIQAAAWTAGDPSPPGSQLPSPRRVLTWWEARSSRGEGGSVIRTLIPSWGLLTHELSTSQKPRVLQLHLEGRFPPRVLSTPCAVSVQGLFVGGLRAFTCHSSDRSTQTRHALLRECGLRLSRLTFLCVSVTCVGGWIIRVAGTGSADECRGWNAGTAPARPSPSVTESVTVPTSHRALRQEPRPRGSKRRLACGHPRHPCVASRLPAPCT